MDFLLRLYAGDYVAFLVGSLLVQVTVIVLLAWGMASLAAGRSAATRHGIWLCALVTALVCPMTTFGIQQMDLSYTPPIRPVEMRTPMPVGSQPLDEGISPPALPNSPQAVVPPPTPSVGDTLRATGSAALCVWLAGVLFFLIRFLHGCLRLRTLCRDVSPISVADIADELCEALSVRQLPRIVISPTLPSPVAVGVLRPMVVLPNSMVETLKQNQLRDVLLHECAHIVRRDPIVGLLQRLAEMLYWPHPLIHLLNCKLARAREEACDDYVLSRSDRRQFGQTLCELSERLSATGLRPAALGLFEPRRQLEERVTGFLDPRRNTMIRVNRSTVGAAILGLVMVVIVVGATGSAGVTSEDPLQPKKALRYDGKEFEWWKKQLFTELKPELRAEALKAIGTFGANGYAEEATRAIVEVMRAYDIDSDKGDQLVLKAAESAVRKIGPSALEPLTVALKGDNETLHRFADRTLSRFPLSEDAFRVLAAATKAQVPRVRQSAMNSLQQYGKKAVPALIDALDAEEADTRQSAASALGEIGPSAKSAVPKLLAATKDKHPFVRAAALDALYRIQPDPKVALPVVIDRLKDDDVSVRSSAIWYLVHNLGPHATGSVPALMEAFPDAYAIEREWIVRALGNSSAKEGIPVILEAMQDENQSVRRAAAEALEKIGKESNSGGSESALQLPSVSDGE